MTSNLGLNVSPCSFFFFSFKNMFSIKLNRVVFERPKLYLKKTVFEVRENVMAQRWNLMAVAGL